MKEYHVMWDIEVDAKNHIEAAETALKIQRDPGSMATAFRVIDMAGKVVFVDLKRDAIPDLRSNGKELTCKEGIVNKLDLNFVWDSRLSLRAEGNKLCAEGDKLRAEGDKLRAESSKLCAEGDKLCAEGNKLCAESSKLYAEGSKLYAEGSKLYAEGNKLRAESSKLYAEGDKLCAEGNKLCAESSKLYAEGDKLYAEGDKLCAEGSIIWVSAIIKCYGNTKLAWRNYCKEKDDYECHLENGEVFKP